MSSSYRVALAQLELLYVTRPSLVLEWVWLRQTLRSKSTIYKPAPHLLSLLRSVFVVRDRLVIAGLKLRILSWVSFRYTIISIIKVLIITIMNLVTENNIIAQSFALSKIMN